MKTREQPDGEALQGVERPQRAQLAMCEYIEGAEDIVIAGPIGTGKAHLAIALGVEAAQRRHRVACGVGRDHRVRTNGRAPVRRGPSNPSERRQRAT